MAFFKVFIAAATIATALAAPHQHGGDVNSDHKQKVSVRDAAAQCGNGQKLSCCNKGDTGASILGDLLGGNCDAISIPIIALDIPISSACTNQVACCPGDQNGLINLACTNLVL
ncbi:hydrophobin [Metarhizium album ARSEF 1941]|uniref:Hydrophobin n=1 Tax=Metarhizium album (strain ARSEF 1941) TaxID=1081103 RepID=A0A0B2WKV8_METAS|nr:hydrophobin [Metarhizium album ARSEF 1941]KHN96691.1 hydrophobin [Metarhizium album ARSEF 1941]